MNKYSNSFADSWYKSIAADPSKLPFTLTYAGKCYMGFSEEFFKLTYKSISTKGDVETTNYTFDFIGDLIVSLKLSHYFSHGITEWTVEFENSTDTDSKVLEDIGTKMEFAGNAPTLKGILGDKGVPGETPDHRYHPYEKDLSKESVSFVQRSSRCSHGNFPYFNLEHADGGTILAIGWAGSWSASFKKINDKTEYFAKSVYNFKSYLRPGEKIRTALFVYAPYTKRDEAFATNFWRSWYLEHNLPRDAKTGKPVEPFSTCCLAYDTGLEHSDGSISERFSTWRPSLEKMFEEDAKVDFRWVDAGWYAAPDGTSAIPNKKGHDWVDTVGTWDFDFEKWPGDTFRESTDFARANGMKTLLWFVPELVTDPEILEKNYGYNPKWAYHLHREGWAEKLHANNIGDPDCYEWTKNRIFAALKKGGVDMYREDQNGDVIRIWKEIDEADGENRHGMAESKYIAAHYRLWDEIIAFVQSYGGCSFVDTCAGGGGRLDIESLRRGISLLRSDLDRTSTAIRLSMTTSFNKWVPFCGANTREKVGEHSKTGLRDPYVWRASYLPVLNVDSQFVYDEEQKFDMLRFGLKEWKKVSPYLLKDFYTLTPWYERDETDHIISYTFYDPDTKRGILFAFCQENCPERELSVTLPFMAENENCTLIDEDTKEDFVTTDGNLNIKFTKARQARLFFYKVK